MWSSIMALRQFLAANSAGSAHTSLSMIAAEVGPQIFEANEGFI